jgi:TPP-dependent pyruvate/acetoin dehydrogenase alpha subunit
VSARGRSGLAAKKRNTDSVAVAYLGEGAVDQGGFLESLNLAAVHDLPVVFVVEDNDWAISTPQERVTDVEFASNRADGFDMPGVHVDRDDAVAVYEAAAEAVGRARDGNGPTVLSIQVHRRMGHLVGDPQSYRSDEDQAAAMDRDSIERMEGHLRDHGVDDDAMAEMREDAHARVDDGFTPIINPPEVAILGVSRVRKRAQPDDDGVAFRETLPLDLSFDHRVVDGADAARFLGTLAERVEDAGRYAAE